MTENRLLKYFLVAAQEENITKAAEILHVSQPALSKQIMQLEEELGAKLFIRGKRSLTLTEEGRFLRGRAQEIVALTEKTERDFRDEGLLIEPAVDLSKYDFLRIPVQDRWGGAGFGGQSAVREGYGVYGKLAAQERCGNCGTGDTVTAGAFPQEPNHRQSRRKAVIARKVRASGLFVRRSRC